VHDQGDGGEQRRISAERGDSVSDQVREEVIGIFPQLPGRTIALVSTARSSWLQHPTAVLRNDQDRSLGLRERRLRVQFVRFRRMHG
jgi:hypothetical protein